MLTADCRVKVNIVYLPLLKWNFSEIYTGAILNSIVSNRLWDPEKKGGGANTY